MSMLTVLQAEGQPGSAPSETKKETVEAQEARLVATYERALKAVANNPHLAEAQLVRLLQDPAFRDGPGNGDAAELQPAQLLEEALADQADAQQDTTQYRRRKPLLAQVYTLALRNLAFLHSDKQPADAAWLYGAAILQQPEKADSVLWSRLGKVAAKAGLLGLCRYALEQGLKTSARYTPLLEQCMEISWVVGDRLGAADFAARLLRLDPYHPHAKAVRQAVQAHDAGSPVVDAELEYEEYLSELAWLPPSPASAPVATVQPPPAYVLALPVDSDLVCLLQTLVQLLMAQLPALADLKVLQPLQGDTELSKEAPHNQQCKVTENAPGQEQRTAAAAATGTAVEATAEQQAAETVPEQVPTAMPDTTLMMAEPIPPAQPAAAPLAASVTHATPGSQPMSAPDVEMVAKENAGAEADMQCTQATERAQHAGGEAQQQPPVVGSSSHGHSSTQQARHLLSMLRGLRGQQDTVTSDLEYQFLAAPQGWEMTLSQPVLLCVTLPEQVTAAEPAAVAATDAAANQQQQQVLLSQLPAPASQSLEATQLSQTAPTAQPLVCASIADMPFAQLSQQQDAGKLSGAAPPGPPLHAVSIAGQHDDKENQQQHQAEVDGAVNADNINAAPVARSPATRKRRAVTGAGEDKERTVRARGAGAKGGKGAGDREAAAGGVTEEPVTRNSAAARHMVNTSALFRDLRNLIPSTPSCPHTVSAGPATGQLNASTQKHAAHVQRDTTIAHSTGHAADDSAGAFKTVCNEWNSVLWTPARPSSPFLLPAAMVPAGPQQGQVKQQGPSSEVSHSSSLHASLRSAGYMTLRELCSSLVQRLLSHPHLLTATSAKYVLQLHSLLQPQTQSPGTVSSESSEGCALSATQRLHLAELYVAHVWHQQQDQLRAQALAQQQAQRHSARAGKARHSKPAAAVAAAGRMPSDVATSEVNLTAAECVSMATRLLGVMQASWAAASMQSALSSTSFEHASSCDPDCMECDGYASAAPGEHVEDSGVMLCQEAVVAAPDKDADDADVYISLQKAHTTWVLGHLAECQEQPSEAVQLYRACMEILASLPEGAAHRLSTQPFPAGLGVCTPQAIAYKLETLHIYAVVDAAEAHLMHWQRQHVNTAQQQSSGLAKQQQPLDSEQLLALLDLAFGPLPARTPNPGKGAKTIIDDMTHGAAGVPSSGLSKDIVPDSTALPCAIDPSLIPPSLRSRALALLHQLSAVAPHNTLLLAVQTATLLAQSQAQLAAAVEATRRPVPASVPTAAAAGDTTSAAGAAAATTMVLPAVAAQLAELLHIVGCVEQMHQHLLSTQVSQLLHAAQRRSCTAPGTRDAPMDEAVQTVLQQLPLSFILSQQLSAFAQELLVYLQRLHAVAPAAATTDVKQAAGPGKDTVKEGTPAVGASAQDPSVTGAAAQSTGATVGTQRPARPTIAVRSHGALSICAKLLLLLHQYLPQATSDHTPLAAVVPTQASTTAISDSSTQLPAELQHVASSHGLWSRLLELLSSKLSAAEMQPWLHDCNQAMLQHMEQLHQVVGGPRAAADILFDEGDLSEEEEEEDSGDAEEGGGQGNKEGAGGPSAGRAATHVPDSSMAAEQADPAEEREQQGDEQEGRGVQASDVQPAVSELLHSVYGALGRLLHLRTGVKLDWFDDMFGNAHGSGRLSAESLDISTPAQVLDVWALLQPLYHVLCRNDQPLKLRSLLEKLKGHMPALPLASLQNSKAYKYLEDPTLCDRDLALGHVRPAVLEPIDAIDAHSQAARDGIQQAGPNSSTLTPAAAQQSGQACGTLQSVTDGVTAAVPMDVDAAAASAVAVPESGTSAPHAHVKNHTGTAVGGEITATKEAPLPAVLATSDSAAQQTDGQVESTQNTNQWTAVRQGLYHLLIQASEPADCLSNYSVNDASHAEVEKAAGVVLCDLMWNPTRASTWEYMAELYCSACRCLLDCAANEMPPSQWVSESNAPVRARLAMYTQRAIRAIAVCIAMAAPACTASQDAGPTAGLMEVDNSAEKTPRQPPQVAAPDPDEMGMLYGSLGQVYLDKVIGCTPLYDSLPPSQKPVRDAEWLADVATAYVLMERAGQHLAGEWTYPCQMGKLLGKLNAAWPVAVEAVRNRQPVPHAAVQALWQPTVPSIQRRLLPPNNHRKIPEAATEPAGSLPNAAGEQARPAAATASVREKTAAVPMNLDVQADGPAQQQQGQSPVDAATRVQGDASASSAVTDVALVQPITVNWVADMLKCYGQACQLALSSGGGAIIQPWYSLHAARLKLVLWAKELVQPHLPMSPIKSSTASAIAVNQAPGVAAEPVGAAPANSQQLTAGCDAAMQTEAAVQAVRPLPSSAALAVDQARQLAKHLAQYCFLPESATRLHTIEYTELLQAQTVHQGAAATPSPSMESKVASGNTIQPATITTAGLQSLVSCLDVLLADCLEAMTWCDSSYKAASSASAVYHRARYQVAKARWWQQQPDEVLEALKGLVGPSMVGKRMVPFAINIVAVTAKMTKAISKRRRRRSTHHAVASTSSLAAAALRPSHVVGIGDDEESRNCVAATRRYVKLYLRAALLSRNVEALGHASAYLMANSDKGLGWQTPMRDLAPVAQGLYCNVLLQQLNEILQRYRAVAAGLQLPALSERDKDCLVRAQALYFKHVVDVLPSTLGSSSTAGSTDLLLPVLLAQLDPAGLMYVPAEPTPLLTEQHIAQLVLVRIQALAASHELDQLLSIASHIRKKLKMASKLGPQPAQSIVIILNPLMSHLVKETTSRFKQAEEAFIEQHKQHEQHLREAAAAAALQAAQEQAAVSKHEGQPEAIKGPAGAPQEQASDEPMVAAQVAQTAGTKAVAAGPQEVPAGAAHLQHQDQQGSGEQAHQPMDMDCTQAALDVAAAAHAVGDGHVQQAETDTEVAMDLDEGSGSGSEEGTGVPPSPKATQIEQQGQGSPPGGLRKTRVTRRAMPSMQVAAAGAGMPRAAAAAGGEGLNAAPAVRDLSASLKSVLSVLQATLAVHPWQLCTSSGMRKEVEDALVIVWLYFKVHVLRTAAGSCPHWAALQSVIATTTVSKVAELSKACDGLVTRLQAELASIGTATAKQLSEEEIVKAAEQAEAQLQALLIQPQATAASQPGLPAGQQQQQRPQAQPQGQQISIAQLPQAQLHILLKLQQQQQQQQLLKQQQVQQQQQQQLLKQQQVQQQQQQQQQLLKQQQAQQQQQQQQPVLVIPAPGDRTFYHQTAAASASNGAHAGSLAARNPLPSPGPGSPPNRQHTAISTMAPRRVASAVPQVQTAAVARGLHAVAAHTASPSATAAAPSTAAAPAVSPGSSEAASSGGRILQRALTVLQNGTPLQDVAADIFNAGNTEQLAIAVNAANHTALNFLLRPGYQASQELQMLAQSLVKAAGHAADLSRQDVENLLQLHLKLQQASPVKAEPQQHGPPGPHRAPAAPAAGPQMHSIPIRRAATTSPRATATLSGANTAARKAARQAYNESPTPARAKMHAGPAARPSASLHDTLSRLQAQGISMRGMALALGSSDQQRELLQLLDDLVTRQQPYLQQLHAESVPTAKAQLIEQLQCLDRAGQQPSKQLGEEDMIQLVTLWRTLQGAPHAASTQATDLAGRLVGHNTPPQAAQPVQSVAVLAHTSPLASHPGVRPFMSPASITGRLAHAAQPPQMTAPVRVAATQASQPPAARLFNTAAQASQAFTGASHQANPSAPKPASTPPQAQALGGPQGMVPPAQQSSIYSVQPGRAANHSPATTSATAGGISSLSPTALLQLMHLAGAEGPNPVVNAQLLQYALQLQQAQVGFQPVIVQLQGTLPGAVSAVQQPGMGVSHPGLAVQQSSAAPTTVAPSSTAVQTAAGVTRQLPISVLRSQPSGVSDQPQAGQR